MKIVAISDYVCPWCYLGLKRIERLQEEFDIEVEWHPFELRPGLPLEGMPMESIMGRGRYTADYFEQLRQLGEEVGVHMKARSFLANSRPAHEASQYAHERGCFEPFHRAVFRAYFEEGENIGDVDVLCRLADTCRLDGSALREALASGRYAHDVDEKVAWVRQRGVAGVPTFIFPTRGGESASGWAASATHGNDTFDLMGAQEYRVFESVAERLGARRKVKEP